MDIILPNGPGYDQQDSDESWEAATEHLMTQELDSMPGSYHIQ